MPLDAADPAFARRIKRLVPVELPRDLPEDVRAPVAARLRESHATHRHNGDSAGVDRPVGAEGAERHQQRVAVDACAVLVRYTELVNTAEQA